MSPRTYGPGLALVMLLAACAPKADDSAGTKAVEGVTVSTSSKAVQKETDSIIGRDSAFGPKFEVDASGKTTPIKRP